MASAAAIPGAGAGGGGGGGGGTGLDADMDRELADESRLMEHNQRFQAAVLSAMDKQLSNMEQQIAARDYTIEMSEKARTDLAHTMGQTRKQMTELRAALNKSNTDLAAARSSLLAMKTERDAVINVNKAITKQRDLSTQTLAAAEQKIAATSNELTQSEQLNKLFTDDVKIHRQLKDNLSLEVKSLQAENRALKESVDKEWRPKYQKQSQAMTALQQALTAQETETKKANSALDKVVNELELLQTSNKVRVNQWEDATAALAKRNELIQQMSAQREAAQDTALGLQNTLANLTTSNAALTKELSAVRQSERQWRDRLTAIETERSKEQADARAVASELRGMKSDTSKAVAGATQAAMEKAKAENERADVAKQLKATREQLDELQRKYAKLEDEFDTQKRTDNANFSKLTGAHNKLHAAQLAELNRLNAQRVAARVESLDADGALREQTLQYELLDSDFRSLLEKYNEVYGEVGLLENELERRNYRANKLEAELTALKAKRDTEASAESRVLHAQLKELTATMEAKKKELDALNATFVRAQTEHARQQKSKSQADADRASLHSRLVLTEQTNEKLKHDNASLEKEHESAIGESTDARLALRRTQTENAALREKCQALEMQLSNSALTATAKAEHSKTVESVLRAELNKYRAEKSETNSLVINNQRERSTYERQIELLTTKLDAQRVETERYAKYAFSLKSQLAALAKDHHNNEKQHREWGHTFEKLFQKELKGRASRARSLNQKEQTVNHNSQSLSAMTVQIMQSVIQSTGAATGGEHAPVNPVPHAYLSSNADRRALTAPNAVAAAAATMAAAAAANTTAGGLVIPPIPLPASLNRDTLKQNAITSAARQQSPLYTQRLAIAQSAAAEGATAGGGGSNTTANAVRAALASADASAAKSLVGTVLLPAAPSETLTAKHRNRVPAATGKGSGTGGGGAMTTAAVAALGMNKELSHHLHTKHDSKFVDNLVGELRRQLAEVSRVSSERLSELQRVRAELSALTVDADAKHERELVWSERLNGASTERSGLQRQLLLANAQYLRAECMAASLEKQLKTALAFIASAKAGTNANSTTAEPAAVAGVDPKIDYSFFPDLEPSPVLRSAISNPDIFLQHNAPATAMGGLTFGSGLNYNDSAAGGVFVDTEAAAATGTAGATSGTQSGSQTARSAAGSKPPAHPQPQPPATGRSTASAGRRVASVTRRMRDRDSGGGGGLLALAAYYLTSGWLWVRSKVPMLQHRISIPFIGVCFTYSMAYSLSNSVLSFRAKSMLGRSGLMYGVVLVAYSVTKMFSAPMIGHLSDRYGRRRAILYTTGGTAITLFVTPLFNSVPWLILCRLSTGCFAANGAMITCYAMDACHHDANVLPQFLQCFHIGWGLSYLLSAPVLHLLEKQTDLVFRAGAGCMFLATAIVYVWFDELGGSLHRENERKRDIAVTANGGTGTGAGASSVVASAAASSGGGDNLSASSAIALHADHIVAIHNTSASPRTVEHIELLPLAPQQQQTPQPLRRVDSRRLLNAGAAGADRGPTTPTSETASPVSGASALHDGSDEKHSLLRDGGSGSGNGSGDVRIERIIVTGPNGSSSSATAGAGSEGASDAPPTFLQTLTAMFGHKLILCLFLTSLFTPPIDMTVLLSDTFDKGPATLGLIHSIQAITRLVIPLTPLVAMIASYYGHQRIATVGTFLNGLVICLLPQVSTLNQLYVLMFIKSIFFVIYEPSKTAYLNTMGKPASVGAYVGWMACMKGFSNVTSGVLGGYLSGEGVAIPFTLTGVIICADAGLIAYFQSPKAAAAAAAAKLAQSQAAAAANPSAHHALVVHSGGSNGTAATTSPQSPPPSSSPSGHIAQS